jgi:hypothetical protein
MIAALAQRHDVPGGIAVGGEDLVAVLAEERCRGGRRTGGVGEFDRLGHRPVAADHRMVEGRD